MGFYRGPNIVKNGLVLWLDAANPRSYPRSGTVWNDMSGNNNTGTLTNGPTFSNANYGSIVFDGVDDYTLFGSILNFTSEPFSFSYWVNFNTLTTNLVNQGPVVLFKGSFQSRGYYSQISTDGNIIFVTNQIGAYQTTTASPGTIIPGNWYNISYTRTVSSVRIYVNGVDVVSEAATHINPATSTDSFRLAVYQFDIYARMNLSSFMTYNKALSAQEVKQNYDALKGRYNLI